VSELPTSVDTAGIDSTAPFRVPAPPMQALRYPPLQWMAPFQWLWLGFKDFCAYPGIGLFYGLIFSGMALLLGAVFRHKPEYTMTLVSGCLLLGPFLAMGLYDVSRRRMLEQTPSLSESITCWDTHMPSIGLLLLVLLVLELLWGRASLVVFAVFFETGMPSTAGVIEAVFNPENWAFVGVYAIVGGLFATLVFSISVVSMPMILDRDTDAISAVLTSLRVVFQNLGVMMLWGALIAALVALALGLWSVGLIAVGPVLGHATWHAYRSSIEWVVPTALDAVVTE
jgi:uncharacterized membrane protein